ncbi:MAG: endonuclease III [Deltaproteobacteria bacterium]|nr:endonuclease III [Deltaproteobacteria bacterium]
MFARFEAHNPDPRCELYYTSNFQLLLSVMLSAQTTDKAVNAAVREAYDAGLGPDDVVRLGADGMLKLIRRIGLAPTKAKRAVALATDIIEKHAGKVPGERAALEALPGVGRKTANVILAELFGAPTLAVDTHVFRVTRRLGLHNEKTPEACETKLMAQIDRKYLPRAHHWFILLGRYTCKALRPACDQCYLADICPSFKASVSKAARTAAKH